MMNGSSVKNQKKGSAIKPNELNEVKTEQGVHVCAINQRESEVIVKLIELYDVWRDRGIILMDEEDKMRIELVEGWQNEKLMVKPYLLGLEDRKFLDTTMDEFYGQGCMSWMRKPILFGCPVFIIWR